MSRNRDGRHPSAPDSVDEMLRRIQQAGPPAAGAVDLSQLGDARRIPSLDLRIFPQWSWMLRPAGDFAPPMSALTGVEDESGVAMGLGWQVGDGEMLVFLISAADRLKLGEALVRSASPPSEGSDNLDGVEPEEEHDEDQEREGEAS